MIIQSRRNFIIGLTSSLAAPAIVRASSLMPIRAIEYRLITEYKIVDKIDILYGCLSVKPEWCDYARQFIFSN